MSADIDSALDALGDSPRRMILSRLAAGPLDVGGISGGMPVGRTAVSMHLRVLKAAGLVSDQRAGNRRVYQLEGEGLQRLRDHLNWYWERSLAAYQRAAEVRARGENVTSDRDLRSPSDFAAQQARHVEACEPLRRLLVTMRETDESYRKGQGAPPFDKVTEATLTPDGNHTILVIEVRGLPWTTWRSSVRVADPR